VLRFALASWLCVPAFAGFAFVAIPLQREAILPFNCSEWECGTATGDAPRSDSCSQRDRANRILDDTLPFDYGQVADDMFARPTLYDENITF
jgi:hypothetical protein